MALQFTRNAEVYVSLRDATSGDHVQSWKLSVLDGFSFTQSINSSEITINEAGTTSRRARLLFNDSLAPVEWSMSTYARPFDSTTSPDALSKCHAVEESLWAMFVGANTWDGSGEVFKKGSNAVNALADLSPALDSTNTFDFSQSNVSSMPDNWDIWFAFEDGNNKQYYKLQSAVVNSVTMDFDIDGIATLQWSGFAKQISDEGVTQPAELGSTSPEKVISNGLTDTANFIRNRISTLSLVRNDKFVGSPDAGLNESSSPGDIQDVYNIVLTGGSISMENNITYLTPEELGVVNAPLANITGARSISGSLTCYLDNDSNQSKSGELFADLVGDTSTVRNVFNMTVNIGGEAVNTPRIAFDLPTAHLEVPVINVEDLLTLEVAFHGQVASGNVDSTNEATIVYKA